VVIPTTAKADLRAVGADEKPAPPKPPLMSVTEAASDGTRLDELRAIRRVLARHMDDETVSGRDLAALSNRYMAVSKEIESLEILEQSPVPKTRETTPECQAGAIFLQARIIVEL
jgi:hypothetical protein